jgi:hypothetical protein
LASDEGCSVEVEISSFTLSAVNFAVIHVTYIHGKDECLFSF